MCIEPLREGAQNAVGKGCPSGAQNSAIPSPDQPNRRISSHFSIATFRLRRASCMMQASSVLKRSNLAHMGSKRTAHLWHTCGMPNSASSLLRIERFRLLVRVSVWRRIQSVRIWSAALKQLPNLLFAKLGEDHGATIRACRNYAPSRKRLREQLSGQSDKSSLRLRKTVRGLLPLPGCRRDRSSLLSAPYSRGQQGN
jgi:hypothetical protein